MEDKHINIMIILFLLLLSVKVLFDFYRRRKFYDNFMESFTNGELRKKMINIANEEGNDVCSTTTADKNFEIGSLKGGESDIKFIREASSSFSLKNIENIKKRTTKIGRRGMNNCLFDSAIASVKNRKEEENFKLPTDDSQELRDLCNKLLEKEGFPLIPDGEPAGEQYIQALSKILDCKIKIYKNHPENFVADVKHSDVSDESGDDEDAERQHCKEISIVHMGPEEHGHWVSLS